MSTSDTNLTQFDGCIAALRTSFYTTGMSTLEQLDVLSQKTLDGLRAELSISMANGIGGRWVSKAASEASPEANVAAADGAGTGADFFPAAEADFPFLEYTLLAFGAAEMSSLTPPKFNVERVLQ
eukprot:CAMPEP_0178765896 /NCGR_PEP_ID=MMETSP0744-20121128/18729_1 /TAXON_ID=913974 /ORGANISM="Nitzschia punctata, Strain CCMP561" /LENGTH=124 /DNA_ID=CAMNT_0020421489 /DNA_START=507 /DNA_END=882 /DNA_ORIENTATION=-